MLDPIRQTILYDQNAIYYGYAIEKLMEKAGRGIANELIKKYGMGKRIGFFCGPGNNGGDGFAAARYLQEKAKPEVYLVPHAKNIRTAESRKNWSRFKGVKQDGVRAENIPDHFDIVVECLFGTGIKGKMKEPYAAVIKKLNKLRGKKVTIDLPAPGYKPQFYISMMFDKSAGIPRNLISVKSETRFRNSAVVDIGYPTRLAGKIGVGEVKVLNRPIPHSHKGDNGKLLIIGGSERYHGALLLATKIAGKIVDMVYVSSMPENNELIKKLKSKLAEFITVPRKDAIQFAKQVDAILIGPGMGTSGGTKSITHALLKKYSKKKTILDADALNIVDKKLLHANCILTPHKKEFKTLFGKNATKENVKAMAKKYNCIIVLKGKTDLIASPFEFKTNSTGNAGMTKGGTGDVLAGLIAALATVNENFLAASAGTFINGLAADRLYKRVSYYYSASELIKEIPQTIKWCENY